MTMLDDLLETLLHEPRIQAAAEEMKRLILEQYPDATFDLDYGDDPAGVYLTVTVDLEDTDEVFDLIVDRLLDMQVEEGLPLHVIPVRTPERRAAMLEAERQRSSSSSLSMSERD